MMNKEQIKLVKSIIEDSQLSQVSNLHYIEKFSATFGVKYPRGLSEQAVLQYIYSVCDFLNRFKPKTEKKVD